MKVENAAAVGKSKVFDVMVVGRPDDPKLERALASAGRILSGEVKVLSPEEAERDRISSRERLERLVVQAKNLSEQPRVR